MSAYMHVRRWYAREALSSPKQAFILQWFLLRELEPDSLVEVGESLQLVQIKRDIPGPDSLVERDNDFGSLAFMIASPPTQQEEGGFAFRWEFRDPEGYLIWDSEEWVAVHRQDPVNMNVLLGVLWELYNTSEDTASEQFEPLHFIPDECARWVECMRGLRDPCTYLEALDTQIHDDLIGNAVHVNILGLARRTLYPLVSREERSQPSFSGITVTRGNPFQIGWVHLVKSLTWMTFMDPKEVQERWQQIFLRRLLDEFCDAYIANVI